MKVPFHVRRIFNHLKTDKFLIHFSIILTTGLFAVLFFVLYPPGITEDDPDDAADKVSADKVSVYTVNDLSAKTGEPEKNSQELPKDGTQEIQTLFSTSGFSVGRGEDSFDFEAMEDILIWVVRNEDNLWNLYIFLRNLSDGNEPELAALGDEEWPDFMLEISIMNPNKEDLSVLHPGEKIILSSYPITDSRSRSAP